MTETNPEKLYHAALYARRKFFERTEPDEPDPIVSEQIKAMKALLKEIPDVKITGVYMDSRKCSANHARPKFHQMIRDIQHGDYNCIVMYSLDMFGKDIYENRYYVLRIFTTLRLRIISLLDEYDSEVSEPDPDSFSKLEELIQLNGSFDTARRLSATAREKKTNGFLELTFTPYGYLYRPDTESNMEIDPETAKYVRFIFREFLAGSSRSEIAKRLTQMGVPSPSLRKKQLGIHYTKPSAKDYWTMGSVRSILKNQMYTGDLLYGTQRSASYVFRECSRHSWPDKPVVIPNHHEALISREDFDRAQLMMSMLTKEYNERSQETHTRHPACIRTPFRNLVFCGHCGRSMLHVQYMSTRSPYSTYICSSHRHKLEDACPLAPIRLSEVIDAAKDALEKERQLALSTYEAIKDGEESETYQKLEAYYQARIDEMLKQGKENTTKLLTLSDTDTEQKRMLEEKSQSLREGLVAAINEKQEFRQNFTTNNTWLKLFLTLEENFAVTANIAKKYISQINLYRDAPAVIKMIKEDAREKLLSYLRFADSVDCR